MPTLSVGGRELFYRDSGGEGPAVLFCHGFLMDHTMFDPQVEALAPEFRCIRFDARGFGRTPADGAFDYWDLAEDAVGLLDGLGVERAAFVGMSQGGYLSLRAAIRHPGRVDALVLIDTQAAVDDPEALAGYREMLGTWTTAGPVDELVSTVAGLILGEDEELREVWMEKWRRKPKEDLVQPAACLLGRDDVTDRLGEIRCPALIVHGTEDVSIPMARAEEMDRRLPNSAGLVRVPGAAHAPNLSHPEVVNPPLLRFLREHLPA